MCGRYSLFVSREELIRRYGLLELNPIEFSPMNEIFPSSKVPVIISMIDNKDPLKIKRVLKFQHWGFPVSFSRRTLINARCETVDQKPLFKKAFEHKRCLVPATCFFEWKKEKSKKIKYKIFLQDSPIFSLAGIYGNFKNNNGELIEAFSIITTEASKPLKMIHNRMPVIIKKENEDLWLNCQDALKLKKMLKPYDGNDLKYEATTGQLGLF